MCPFPLSSDVYSDPHPDAHDGGEEPDGSPAAISIGKQHNEHQVNDLALVAAGFKREEQRNEGLQDLAGKPGNGPGRWTIETSVGRE